MVLIFFTLIHTSEATATAEKRLSKLQIHMMLFRFSYNIVYQNVMSHSTICKPEDAPQVIAYRITSVPYKTSLKMTALPDLKNVSNRLH